MHECTDPPSSHGLSVPLLSFEFPLTLALPSPLQSSCSMALCPYPVSDRLHVGVHARLKLGRLYSPNAPRALSACSDHPKLGETTYPAGQLTSAKVAFSLYRLVPSTVTIQLGAYLLGVL